MHSYEELLRRGFSKKEALRTINIIKKAEENKTAIIKILDSMVYWLLLLIAIVGNLIISIVLIPFLLVLKPIPLYFVIILLASMFGFLFDQVIRETEHLKLREHILAWLFIPALSVIDTYYMTSFANYLKTTLDIAKGFNSPIYVSILYVCAFIAPYIIGKITERPINEKRVVTGI